MLIFLWRLLINKICGMSLKCVTCYIAARKFRLVSIAYAKVTLVLYCWHCITGNGACIEISHKIFQHHTQNTEKILNIEIMKETYCNILCNFILLKITAW